MAPATHQPSSLIETDSIVQPLTVLSTEISEMKSHDLNKNCKSLSVIDSASLTKHNSVSFHELEKHLKYEIEFAKILEDNLASLLED